MLDQGDFLATSGESNVNLKLLVVSGNYRKTEGGVVIELFGRCGDGRSATVLYGGFRPYFYIVEPNEEDIAELGRDPLVVGITDRTLWHSGRNVNCAKVVITYPFEVPKYRKRFQEKGYEILAADIPFIFRFFYDLDLGIFLEIEGEEVNGDDYTTDIVVEARRLEACDPFKVRLKVLSFDIENSIRTGELYMIGYSVGWAMDGEIEREIGNIVPPENAKPASEGEMSIIRGLESAIARFDPDIITGYNIDGYDLPHIQKRANKLGCPGLIMGRDGSGAERFGFRSWKTRGRVIVDAWWEAKKTFRPKKETLNSVANLLLGEGKDDIDVQKIEDEWYSRRQDVIRYCEKDADLAFRILQKTMAVRRGMDLGYVAKLPLQEVLTGTTSVLIDSILIREADKNDIGIPLTRHEKKTSKIEGGYVHSVEPGLYHWVAVLDFRSMYPSLMIRNNVCFTTITSEGKESTPSPIPGVHFLRSEMKKGLVPEILRKLMEDRHHMKEEMKKARDADRKDYYNGLQDAVKVLMNSFYGVFASYFYRFTDRSIGASITAYARESIRSLISTLESEGYRVIYSDTDSVFVESPHPSLDKTLEFGKSLANRFSSGGAVLEFEKLLDPFFTHGKKKRYVGRQIWPVEKMVVRGYEMRRTDSFDLQSEALARLFDHILDGDTDGALIYSRDIIKRCKEGQVPVESLVISRSVQEVEEERIRQVYKNPDSMANIQALRKTKLLGIEIVPGMKVSWIVVDARFTPQVVEPYLEGRTFDHEADHQYYAERLASTLSRVTEVFGVTDKDLIAGFQQSSLFDDFPDGEELEQTPAVKEKTGMEKKNKTNKNPDPITLDRWM